MTFHVNLSFNLEKKSADRYFLRLELEKRLPRGVTDG